MATERQIEAVIAVLKHEDHWNLVWNAYDDCRPTEEEYLGLATAIMAGIEGIEYGNGASIAPGCRVRGDHLYNRREGRARHVTNYGAHVLWDDNSHPRPEGQWVLNEHLERIT